MIMRIYCVCYLQEKRSKNRKINRERSLKRQKNDFGYKTFIFNEKQEHFKHCFKSRLKTGSYYLISFDDSRPFRTFVIIRSHNEERSKFPKANICMRKAFINSAFSCHWRKSKINFILLSNRSNNSVKHCLETCEGVFEALKGDSLRPPKDLED